MFHSETKYFRDVPKTIAFWAALTAAIAAFAACNHPAPEEGYDAVNKSDCLPAITLTDQHNKPVVLSSLKGKAVLVDFIYTSCPGPCLTETQKMAKVADSLSRELGSKVVLLSVTVDPEHDGPQQLLEYTKKQDVERPGWYFLTASPKTIEQVLSNFQADPAARTGRDSRPYHRDLSGRTGRTRVARVQRRDSESRQRHSRYQQGAGQGMKLNSAIAEGLTGPKNETSTDRRYCRQVDDRGSRHGSGIGRRWILHAAAAAGSVWRRRNMSFGQVLQGLPGRLRQSRRYRQSSGAQSADVRGHGARGLYRRAAESLAAGAAVVLLRMRPNQRPPLFARLLSRPPRRDLRNLCKRGAGGQSAFQSRLSRGANPIRAADALRPP